MPLARAASGAMTFPQHLVLWLHIAFVVFTIGPLTVAIMSTPRYIRQRDVRILRYLSRITFIFTFAAIVVLIAGMSLAQMLGESAQPWVIVSATLFVVAMLLLVLIVRDQRRAIRALERAAAAQAPAHEAGHAGVSEPGQAGGVPGQGGAPDAGQDPDRPGHAPREAGSADPARSGGHAHPEPAPLDQAHLASVERGRIAMTGGVVSLIWLVILVLMVWNS